MKQHVMTGFCLIVIHLAQAQELFIANFEAQPTYSSLYHDLEDPNTPHPLINNFEEPILNVDSNNNQLGYQAFYTPYDDPSNGLSDGDQVGITDDIATVGSFYEGSQGYVMSDIDGNFTLNFAEVSLSEWSEVIVSCQVFIKESTYEGDGTQNASNSDRLAIYVTNPINGDKIDLLDTTGSDIDDLNIEGRWLSLSASIPEFDSAQLVVEARNNASSEAFYIDHVQFQGQLGARDHLQHQTAVIPNPIDYNFSLTRRPSALKEIYIQNIFGRIVWRGDVTQESWGIAHLNSGLYFLNVADSDNFSTQKIIKK